MKPEPIPSQSLAVVGDRGVQLATLGEMMDFARSVQNSGLAPKSFTTPEAILVAMQHGMELGLPPMQALQSIAVINGRPCVWGDGAAALVRSHPEFSDMIETMEKGATEESQLARCEILRKGKQPVIRTFSIKDAKRANLWGKGGPWTQYPGRMLQMRARSWAMRDAFPDALRGMQVAEEVRDIEPPKQAKAHIVSEDLVFPDEPQPEPAETAHVIAMQTEQVGDGGEFVWEGGK